MRLGTGLITCQRRPDDDRSPSAIYDEALTFARAADEAGLDGVWVSEHHFQHDGYLSGVVPALGAIAAVTERVEVGPCVALAPLYHPVRLAEDVATIDRIADGRATLGLAIGSNPREFDALGVPREKRADRLADAVRVCRGAWSEGPLAYESAFHDASPEVEVTPTPDGDVPIVLGGSARPAVRRAARIGDGWCAPSSLSVEGVRTRVADAVSVREDEGIDGEFRVYVLVHGFVGDSREDAWERMREGYLYLQRRYEEIFTGEAVAELSDERRRELRERAILGAPERVADELAAYRDALDEFEDVLGAPPQVIFRAYHPGIGTERMTECVRRLGAEVRPALA